MGRNITQLTSLTNPTACLECIAQLTSFTNPLRKAWLSTS